MNLLEAYAEEVKNFPLLGYTTFWNVREVSVEEDALKSIYANCGLEKYFPEHVSPRKSFWRALQDIGKKHPDLLIRKIGENDEKIAYGVVAESQKFENLDLKYRIECHVIFTKGTCDVKFSDETHPAATEFKSLYEMYRTHFVSHDIRKAILDAITKMDSLDIRKQGGVYFVPVTHSDLISKFANLVSQLGDSTLAALPLIDTQRARQEMFRAFLEQATVELNEAEEEIRLMKDEMNVRKDTVERRLKHFKELRNKASMYVELFKGKADDIEERIQGLEKGAIEVLTALTEGV